MFIKCLRTDRGGEYNSIAFKEFCKAHGIKRQLAIAFTPQQNGVVERKNRTIMNMVRTALLEKEVPKVFWPDAMQGVNHILNRSPTLIVKDMTPEEAWSERKPSVEHFRILDVSDMFISLMLKEVNPCIFESVELDISVRSKFLLDIFLVISGVS